MKVFIAVSLVVALVFALWLVVICARSKKPIRCFLLLSILGLACIVTINLLSGFTGVKIPLNIYTVATGAILGVPGVIGLLIINVLL